ncbi:MAG: hypothetical protein L0H37_07440 [Nitrosospira sp.]|nr:hypothetical protein [Nitrosospira sp.]
MQVILHTNVLVAALIAPNGPPRHLFEAFLGDRFTLITGNLQMRTPQLIAKSSRAGLFQSLALCPIFGMAG